MVNYKRVLCEAVLVVLLAVSCMGAPCDSRHYDQRQNGTENYRLNIDGVVIAIAPAESLLAAASDFDISDLLDLGSFDDFKPDKPDDEEPQKPILDPKPPEIKPPALDVKPEELAKPEEPSKPAESPLSDVSLNEEGQKKDVLGHKKQEKAKRLKNRLASMLMPLLRKTRHH